MTIASDVQLLSPGDLIILFQLDATVLGDSIYHFHAGTNELKSNVIWQGVTYLAFPIEATGFDLSTKGTLPRPTVKIANITGLIGSMTRALGDLIGAKVTRKRTFVKYLDAVNFTGGVNASADPNTYFDDDIYFVNRKVSENRVFIEFELASTLDVEGTKLPRRQVMQNSCSWKYRSPECTYAGGPVADAKDALTSSMSVDTCGKRLTSCKLRFGTYAILPFGNFPGSGLLS